MTSTVPCAPRTISTPISDHESEATAAAGRVIALLAAHLEATGYSGIGCSTPSPVSLPQTLPPPGASPAIVLPFDSFVASDRSVDNVYSF